MPSTIDGEKKALRRQVREQLAALTAGELRAGDDALFSRFLALPQVKAAEVVFAFWGVPGREPDTARLVWELVRAGKSVGLPRMLPGRQMEVRRYDPDKPLVTVSFGISEPGEDCPLIGREDIDLTLVPAVCYDRRGYRLGFGGGYYDRWLERFSGIRVGMCREAVLQDRVPAAEHDAKVDILLTEGESRILNNRKKAGDCSPASFAV